MTTVETIRARWNMAEMHVVEQVEVTALNGDPNDYTDLYRHAWPDVAALLAVVDGLRAERAADARSVAVGRACLAEAAARRDYMARVAADGCDDLAALQALRAAWAEARLARAAAVDAAMQGEA